VWLMDLEERIIAVYPSADVARAAARDAVDAGAPASDVRVAEPLDRIVSVQAEMHDEMRHTIMGPGNVGPFTKEMTKGMTLGVAISTVIGALVALPFAAIGFGGWPLWLRLLVLACIGAIIGATVGWIIGGGFGARRPDAPLAAEEGVTVTAPALEAVQSALLATSPIRLDIVVSDSTGTVQTVRTVATDEDTRPSTARELGRHMGNESHEN